MNKPELICVVDGHNGIYTPLEFAELYGSYIRPDDLAILLDGPDHEDYWDTWATVLDNCKVGNQTIYQSMEGDVFLVPEGCFVDEWGQLVEVGELQSLDEFVSLVELAETICWN